MDRDVNRVIEEALELPPEDRRRVAERIYESMPEDEITAAWLDEIERREEEWGKGDVQGIDADDIIREARASLKK
ncbi:MAG TPA: addiction module protein [Candidatus Kapabacteria bacterium]|nr:addiction module protein [Candidatus Kapabacteria bacterium]